MTGVQPQLNAAFAGATPRLITITIGANDVHWSDFINGCFSTPNCNSETNAKLFDSYVATLDKSMQHVLTSIQVRSGDDRTPLVVVTGYYRPVSDLCLGVTPLTSAEIDFINQKTDKLNQTLQEITSRYEFAKFAPVSFTGHDICSANPWVQTFNQPAPFHPTAQGQAVIANSVVNTITRDK